MQLNNIVMALAGAERIFALLDEQPEVDDGYVTLVRARQENGQIAGDPKSVRVCGHGSIPIRQTAVSIIWN